MIEFTHYMHGYVFGAQKWAKIRYERHTLASRFRYGTACNTGAQSSWLASVVKNHWARQHSHSQRSRIGYISRINTVRRRQRVFRDTCNACALSQAASANWIKTQRHTITPARCAGVCVWVYSSVERRTQLYKRQLTFTDFQQSLQQFAIEGIRYGVLKQKRLSVYCATLLGNLVCQRLLTRILDIYIYICNVPEHGNFARCQSNLLKHTHIPACMCNAAA